MYAIDDLILWDCRIVFKAKREHNIIHFHLDKIQIDAKRPKTSKSRGIARNIQT